MKTLRFTLWLCALASTLYLQAQDTLIIHSPHIPRPDTVWVYAPAADKAPKPIVLMLHGYGGSHQQWPSLVPLQTLAVRYDMWLVCPDGLHDSWYWDSPRRPQWRYETFLTQELIPQLRKTYGSDTTQVYIMGLSMGGHGAIRLALRHPQLFAGAGSSSGVLDLKYSGLRNSNLPEHLGPYTRNLWLPYMAIGQLSTPKDPAQAPPMWIDCGTDDYLLPANRKFVAKARKLGYQVHYTEHPGAHTRAYWAAHAEAHLAFFRNIANKAFLTTPR